MKFETPTLTIETSGNRIVCNYKKHQITETTISPTGAVQKTARTFEEVFKVPALPYFTANYSPKNEDFDVDLDCGALRWTGPKSVTEVRKALKHCGLKPDEVKEILKSVIRSEK